MSTFCAATDSLFSLYFAFVIIVLIDLLRSMTCLIDSIAMGMSLLVVCLKWNIAAELMNALVSGSCMFSQVEMMGPRSLVKQNCR